jgi:DNA-binding NarL/FixJ family response regulator
VLGQSGGRQLTFVGGCGSLRPHARRNESPGNQVPLGTMDDVFEIVRLADCSLAVIGVPAMTILAVNEACVELFGETATALVGRHAGSLFHGADQVNASIALSALAAGSIDSYNARRRVATRGNAEAWVCVRTFDVEGVHIALAAVVPADRPRPLDAVEEELAKATNTRWVSPTSSTGRPASPRAHSDMDTYSVLDGLSPRQQTVIAALMQGERTSAIARSQFVSESTIRSHLSVIYRAFGVHSQTELLSMLRMRNSSSAGAGPPNR